MNINTLKKFAGHNSLPIIFILFLIFSVVIFAQSQSQRRQQIRAYINYNSETLNLINDQVFIITQESQLAENLPENYDKFISNLKSLENQVSYRLEFAPRTPNQENINQIETLLPEIEQYLSFVIVDNLIFRLEEQKNLIQTYQEYSELNKAYEESDRDKLFLAFEAGMRILNFEKRALERVTDDGLRAIYLEEIGSLEKRLEGLQKALEEDLEVTIKAETKKKIFEAYNGNFPKSPASFPELQRKFIFTSDFEKMIDSVQANLQLLEQEFTEN